MLLASGFGAGYMPVAPGTWGSLVALPIHLLLVQLDIVPYSLALLAILVLSILLAGSAEKIIDAKDPGVIVIEHGYTDPYHRIPTLGPIGLLLTTLALMLVGMIILRRRVS